MEKYQERGVSLFGCSFLVSLVVGSLLYLLCLLHSLAILTRGLFACVFVLLSYFGRAFFLFLIASDKKNYPHYQVLSSFLMLLGEII